MKVFSILISLFICNYAFCQHKKSNDDTLIIKRCSDFAVTGKGDNTEWEKASWNQLNKLDPGGAAYISKYKILYSAKGIYILFYGEDTKITTTFENDFDDLFKADVFEVFFHPDPATGLYLEYEINALEKELVLLIPNLKGKVSGWKPWHYEQKKVIKKVYVEAGEMKPGATVKAWSAELFFPYQLLNALPNSPPGSGTVWNINFCRLDYDSGKMVKWSRCIVERSFHEFEKFLPARFE